MSAPLIAAAVATASVAFAEVPWSAGTPDVARFAIVIGVNQPLPGSDYDTLRYADDDALRFAEFFESTGVDTVVLTAPDRETAERYPRRAGLAVRPTRGQLERSLDALEEKLRAAADRPRELYFVFSGHGSITSSLAYLHLFDAPFTRTDLYEQILERLPAEKKHIIIDSCHSYFLVNARGRRVAVATETENLDRHPNAGFLLSTSDSREVQEWSGYDAGVFSYQVLGALRGAADVDGDGIVSYDEVHAYVVAANLGVKRQDARIQPFVRRPVIDASPLFDLRHALEDVFRIPHTVAGHFFITDDLGVRVLDANKPDDEDLWVLLPERSAHYVHHGEQVFQLAQASLVPVPSPSQLLALNKGTVADEFRTNLFTAPLTRDFVRGISAASTQVTRVHAAPDVAWHEDGFTLGLLGGGTVAALIAVGLSIPYASAVSTANAEGGTLEGAAARDRAFGLGAGIITGASVGAALLTAGVLRGVFVNRSAPSVEVGVGPNGVVVEGAF
ncbi:MAG: caspase family protein [Deltaproteobacteria bacterium]